MSYEYEIADKLTRSILVSGECETKDEAKRIVEAAARELDGYGRYRLSIDDDASEIVCYVKVLEDGTRTISDWVNA